jgi:hypothetical protein
MEMKCAYQRLRKAGYGRLKSIWYIFNSEFQRIILRRSYRKQVMILIEKFKEVIEKQG